MSYNPKFTDLIISTHAPRVRRDAITGLLAGRANFYSRASCEARLAEQRKQNNTTNFYSRASCEARL